MYLSNIYKKISILSNDTMRRAELAINIRTSAYLYSVCLEYNVRSKKCEACAQAVFAKCDVKN